MSAAALSPLGETQAVRIARQVHIGDQRVDGDGVQDGQCLGGVGRFKDFEGGVAEVGSRDQPQQNIVFDDQDHTRRWRSRLAGHCLALPASKGAGAALPALLRRQPRTGAWASAAV